MRQDPIVIVDHDADWARSFREQADRLTPLMTAHLVAPIEHIGSTAVPGLSAKPIIDMLAVIRDDDRFGRIVPEVESIGWLSAPEPGDPESRKRSLCFPTVEHRSHHLHVVEADSAGWRDWLLFRDYLRVHADEVERYAAHKRALAEADDRDRVRYRAGKAPLITELLARARRWERDGRP